jgi:hypothetical protein
MSDEELVKRLRRYAKDQGGWHNIDDTCEEAADRIEQLVAINEALTVERDEHWKSFVHWRKEADGLTEQLEQLVAINEAARADATLAEIEGEKT